jgi:hypothetical protein
MFGTISHVKVKPGTEAARKALDEEWNKTMRPGIPGSVLFFRGSPDGKPDTEVSIFLCQDRKTYFALADDPAQDAFFKRVMEHYEGEPTWEDIEVEVVIQD